MAAFLSRAWFRDLNRASERAGPLQDTETTLRIKQVVKASPFGDVVYVVVLDQGRLSFRQGESQSDLTLTEDYDTAKGLASGHMRPREALAAGKVRAAGDLAALVRATDALEALQGVLADVAAHTTW